MEEMLIKLFTKADWNGTGYLTANEFREILDSLNLGITSFQQTILMAGATEEGSMQSEEEGLLVPPTKKALEALTVALYEQVQLESRRGDLTINFNEEPSAAITAADAGGVKTSGVKKSGIHERSKESRTRSQEFLDMSKKQQFLPKTLAQVDRPVVVVSDDGKPLSTNGDVWYPGRGSMWIIQMSLTMNTFYHSVYEEEWAKLEGIWDGGRAEKEFKLPSLALADEEAAESFGANITENIKVVGGGMAGGFSFVF